MRILIIEDAEFMAKAMQSALTEQGHQVDWIIGVRSFAPFIGITETKQDIAIDLSVYDIALCDGELFGSNHGPAVVEALVAHGVPCIGMSSTPDLNKDMVQNGAVAAFLKVCVFAAIVEQILDMNTARQCSQQVQQEVTALEQRLREDKALKTKLNDILTRFM